MDDKCQGESVHKCPGSCGNYRAGLVAKEWKRAAASGEVLGPCSAASLGPGFTVPEIRDPQAENEHGGADEVGLERADLLAYRTSAIDHRMNAQRAAFTFHFGSGAHDNAPFVIMTVGIPDLAGPDRLEIRELLCRAAVAVPSVEIG